MEALVGLAVGGVLLIAAALHRARARGVDITEAERFLRVEWRVTSRVETKECSVEVAGCVFRVRTHECMRGGRAVLILVHGANTGSGMWYFILDKLVPFADVVLVDLPGFGAADCPDALRAMPPEGTASFYAQTLAAFVRARGLRGSTLVGHSFGGFVCAHAASAAPHLFARVVLISPVGLLPTLGPLGFYWALFFKLRVMHSLLVVMGSPHLLASLTMVRLFAKNDAATVYATQLAASPTCIEPSIVARFITLSGSRGPAAWWNTPCLPAMLAMPVPLSLIYGETDTIIPAAQGALVCGLLGGGVRCWVVEGAWHNPVRTREGNDVAGVLYHITRGQGGAPQQPRERAAVLTDALMHTPNFAAAFASTPDRSATQKTIDSLHKALEDLAPRLPGGEVTTGTFGHLLVEKCAGKSAFVHSPWGREMKHGPGWPAGALVAAYACAFECVFLPAAASMAAAIAVAVTLGYVYMYCRTYVSAARAHAADAARCS